MVTLKMQIFRVPDLLLELLSTFLGGSGDSSHMWGHYLFRRTMYNVNPVMLDADKRKCKNAVFKYF